jgi:hypothetical protein
MYGRNVRLSVRVWLNVSTRNAGQNSIILYGGTWPKVVFEVLVLAILTYRVRILYDKYPWSLPSAIPPRVWAVA